MSMVHIPRDDEGDILDVTMDSVTLTRFFKDSKCEIKSTRFLGKYQQITKYSLKHLKPMTKFDLHNYLKNAKGNFTGDYVAFRNMIELEKVNVLSVTIAKNNEYDPEYWQGQYNQSLEAIESAEEKGYSIF